MNIPNDKIEENAVHEIESIAHAHNALSPEISSHDKSMSYDGIIWLFNSSGQHSKKTFDDKIPVQVKGHIDDKEEFLNKRKITYAVEVDDLRVYSEKEGVVYFQVFMKSDWSRKEIFYTSLYGSKLKSVLKEVKENQKSKSIVFRKMNKDADELFSILKQFSRESKQQGSIHTGIVENMIPIEKLPLIKEMHFEAVGIRDEFDLLKRLSAGDICVYGKISDIPMRFPIEWNDGNQVYLIKELDIPIKVSGVEYYKTIRVSRSEDKEPLVAKFSDNLSFEIATARFAFRAVSTLKEIEHDIAFLRAVIANKKFQFLDNTQETPLLESSRGLEESMAFFEDLIYIIENVGIKIEERFDSLSDKEINSLCKLVRIRRGEFNANLPEKITHFDWKYNDKYVPLIIHLQDTGFCEIRNAIYTTSNMFYVTENEEDYYRVISFGYLDKAVVDDLYTYDYESLMSQIEIADINDLTRETLNMAVLRMIQAYDVCGEKRMLVAAEKLCDKIQDGSSLYKVNSLQIKKRKEELTDADLAALDTIRNENDGNDNVICAVDILKGDNASAQGILANMAEEQRKAFMDWPIYNLLEK